MSNIPSQQQYHRLLLRNVMYNGMLLLPLSKQTTVIDFADGLVAFAVAKQFENVEVYANKAFRAIKAWLELVQLDLVEQKTEEILIANDRKGNTAAGGHTITSKPAISTEDDD